MEPLKIPLELARRMALHTQLLDGASGLSSGKEGVAQAIEMLGYVQIDTIAVVQRAHHHTLWTRRADYEPDMLHALQAQDRRVFEYWGHAASYLPIYDYRYYLPRMRRNYTPTRKWIRQWLAEHGQLLRQVEARIREEGPLTSKDFKPPPGMKRGTWWDWKPAKIALELLFWRGELMITERRNFQRVYDLTERVLPADTDTRMPDDDELGRFLVRRALAAHGVAQEREIREHIRGADGAVIAKALADLVDAGDTVPVSIDGLEGGEYYVLSDTLDRSAGLAPLPPAVHLLSPFDNLVIQRDRTERLFGFQYALECYTPAAKRTYGYFVLPILWGERFAGRLDAKADRKQKVLILRGLFFEPQFDAFDPFLPTFVGKLAAFARFNECTSITVEQVTPLDVRAPLERHLKAANLLA